MLHDTSVTGAGGMGPWQCLSVILAMSKTCLFGHGPNFAQQLCMSKNTKSTQRFLQHTGFTAPAINTKTEAQKGVLLKIMFLKKTRKEKNYWKWCGKRRSIYISLLLYKIMYPEAVQNGICEITPPKHEIGLKNDNKTHKCKSALIKQNNTTSFCYIFI